MAAQSKETACGVVSLRRHCPDQVPGGRRPASELSPASQPFLPAPGLPGTPFGPAPSITSQTMFTLHGADDGRLESKARPGRAKRLFLPSPRSRGTAALMLPVLPARPFAGGGRPRASPVENRSLSISEVVTVSSRVCGGRRRSRCRRSHRRAGRRPGWSRWRHGRGGGARPDLRTGSGLPCGGGGPSGVLGRRAGARSGAGAGRDGSGGGRRPGGQPAAAQVDDHQPGQHVGQGHHHQGRDPGG